MDCDDCYERMLEAAMDERIRNEAILRSLGFYKVGGFTREDYPIFIKGSKTVIMSHHQATNLIYSEGFGPFDTLDTNYTRKVEKLEELL